MAGWKQYELYRGCQKLLAPVTITCEEVGTYYFKDGNAKKYEVSIYDNELGYLPFIELGYRLDTYIDLEGFVSPIHSAVNRILKTIKQGSELDLTTTLHAFPQKLQFVDKCQGHYDDGILSPCNSGKFR